MESEYEEDYVINIEDIKSEYYPIYNNHINGYTLYSDIHIYLLSKFNEKKNPKYPDFVYDGDDKSINNNKKYFWYLCINYELNKYNELCYKKIKKNNNRKNKGRRLNRHKKNKEDYNLL